MKYRCFYTFYFTWSINRPNNNNYYYYAMRHVKLGPTYAIWNVSEQHGGKPEKALRQLLFLPSTPSDFQGITASKKGSYGYCRRCRGEIRSELLTFKTF